MESEVVKDDRFRPATGEAEQPGHFDFSHDPEEATSQIDNGAQSGSRSRDGKVRTNFGYRERLVPAVIVNSYDLPGIVIEEE